MDKGHTFETGGKVIDLEQVVAFDEVHPAGEAAEGVHVYLKDGATVPVHGEREANEFIEALEELLE